MIVESFVINFLVSIRLALGALQAADKTIILNAHNDERRNVNPTATNMIQLVRFMVFTNLCI